VLARGLLFSLPHVKSLGGGDSGGRSVGRGVKWGQGRCSRREPRSHFVICRINRLLDVIPAYSPLTAAESSGGRHDVNEA